MTARSWRTPLRLFAAALVIRALPWASVYDEDSVFLRGPDAYYHLRRIFYTLTNYPEALVFDRYVQFPHGAKIIWPPFLDTLFATLLWPVAQLRGLEGAEVVAPWLPPILGAITVVVTWAGVRRHFGDTAALGAGGLLCVLGGHFVYSRLGALDHHVAVSLVSALLLFASLDALRAASLGSMRRPALLVGGLAGIALLVWPGALLYAALALAGLAAVALCETERERAAQHWMSLALAGLLATCIVAPFSLGNEWPQWSSMTPVVLSSFQPWFFACAALVALAPALAGRGATGSGGAAGRALLAVGTGAVLLGASALLSADLRDGFADAWRWLAKGEEFQASVVESQGLFMVNGKPSDSMARLQLSMLVYAFPVLWLFGCVEAARRTQRGPLVFLLVWSGVLFAVTLLQKRFLDAFSVAFAATCAATAMAFWKRYGGAPDGLAARAALAAIVLALIPLAGNYTPHLDNLLRSFQDEPLRLGTLHRANRILVGVSRWIRTYTPRTAGWLSAEQQPEYGIMAPWSAGHIIQQVARRPTVVDNFGDDAGAENYALERRFWASTTDESSGILDELGARYVLVTDGDPRAVMFGFYSTYRKLLLRDGSGQIDRAGRALTRGSERYRLLMESQQLSERARRPYAKLFEHVEGAVLRGLTTPEREVGLSIPIRTNRERRFHYRDRVTSDAEGSFAFRVPYAVGGGPEAVQATGPYTLRCGLAYVQASVDEIDVLTGREILVDDPCTGRTATPPKPRRPPRQRRRR